jgi:protein SDA1
LLEKKDRGRGADLGAKPKAYGEQEVPSSVPGVELLAEASDEDGSDEDGSDEEGSDEESEGEQEPSRKRKGAPKDESEVSEGNEIEEEGPSRKKRKVGGGEDAAARNGGGDEGAVEGGDDESGEESDGSEAVKSDDELIDSDGEDSNDEAGSSDEEEIEADAGGQQRSADPATPSGNGGGDESLGAAKTVEAPESLRSLKRKAAELAAGDDVIAPVDDVTADGILSDEDFRRIRRLQAKKALEAAMAKHGVRKVKGKEVDVLPSKARGDLSDRRVDPGDLDATIRKKQEKVRGPVCLGSVYVSFWLRALPIVIMG